jgi:hypothetical protein
MPIQPMSTNAFVGAHRSYLIVGPSGVGKTSCIPTASAKCPPHVGATVALPPADAKSVLLDDVAILSFDSGGGSCFPSRKVEFSHYYDFSDVAPMAALAETLDVIKRLVPLCASGQIRHVFLDTGTALNNTFELKHAGKENNPKYAGMLTDWSAFLGAWKLLKAHTTIFAQPKAVWDANEAATLKREIKGLPGAHAKITGDALERIRADVDFRFWVERGKEMVGGKPVERVYWVTGDRERDCKDRVYGNLPAKIEADYRVLQAWGR